ncbi:MAG: CsiV family protein [Gammaproteobacteria bacterium]|jgi:hypothetical protein
MRKLTFIAAALTLAGTAAGQANRSATDDPAAEPDPVYHVELIVFAYNAGDRGEEDFRHGLEQLGIGPEPRLLQLPAIALESLFDPAPEPEPPADDSGATAIEPTGLEQTGPGDRLELIELDSPPGGVRTQSDDELPGEFRLLSRNELELGDARSRLDRLGAYAVLGHVGWAQAGVDTDRSVALDLKRLGFSNPKGTIEVSVRRFFRVALDIEYFDGSGALWTRSDVPGLAPLQYADSYRLTTERTAIRRDDLHFIDHPLLGVLVRITRAPEVDEAGREADGSRPAG